MALFGGADFSLADFPFADFPFTDFSLTLFFATTVKVDGFTSDFAGASES